MDFISFENLIATTDLEELIDWELYIDRSCSLKDDIRLGLNLKSWYEIRFEDRFELQWKIG